jgi:cell wall assembly regulator SMI1
VTEMRRFLDGLHRRPGATEAAIAESEKQLGAKLPAEYVEFLKLTPACCRSGYRCPG